MKRFWLYLFLVSLGGCTSGWTPCDPHPTGHGCQRPVAYSKQLPYDAWGLGFLAPDYMEVWVEAAQVEDVRGRIFPRSGGGTVAIGYSRDPAGWPERPGIGAGIDIIGADLPKRIYVRWQSLAEPQTYEAVLEIPEEARRLMLTKAPSVRDPSRSSYRNRLVVGLAPGGAMKVWIHGPLGVAVEAMCTQATVAQEGPYGGKSGGKHRPLSDRAAPYVAANSIPYASWKCDDE